MFALYFIGCIILMACGIIWHARLRWSHLLYLVPLGLAIAVLLVVIVLKVGW